MKPENRKCKYDLKQPQINPDLQTKCVTCEENDADKPNAYKLCLEGPVENEYPTETCESPTGCTLLETKIEERKWENGKDEFVKTTNTVQ